MCFCQVPSNLVFYDSMTSQFYCLRWGVQEDFGGWRGALLLCMKSWATNRFCLQGVGCDTGGRDVCPQAAVSPSSLLAPLTHASICKGLHISGTLHATVLHSGGGIILTGKYKDMLYQLVQIQLARHFEAQHWRGTVRAACRAVQARKVSLSVGREWRE